MDDISLALQICCSEVQQTPKFLFADEKNATGLTVKYYAFFTLNGNKVSIATGQNKKEAKKKSAKIALILVAPVVYAEKYGIIDEEELLNERQAAI